MSARLRALGALLGSMLALAARAEPAATGGPSSASEALALADAALAAGRRDEAERVLRAAAARFDSARALLQLARLQAGSGDAAGALATLGEASRLAPNSEELLHATAQMALAARRPLPAMLALQNLTRLAPDEAAYHYLLGVALMQAGDMLAACEALTRAEQLEPQRALTLVALGLALNNRKLYDQAAPYLRRGLALEPDSLEAAAALAEAEEGLGELDAAARRAEGVLARDARQPTANLVLGMVEMKRGRHAQARVALTRAVEADPALTKAYYQLSLADARLGDAAAAEQHLSVYRRKLEELEEHLKELRTKGAMPGMGRQP